MPETKQPSPASFADFTDAQEGGWVRTLVQFFAIPFLIVCVAVGLYVGINLLLGSGPKTAADFVKLLQSDTINRRTQAAFELQQRIGHGEVPPEFRDPKLVKALCVALDKAREEEQDPPYQAQVVLSLLGRIGHPAAIDAVRRAVDDPHPWVRCFAIHALPALGDSEYAPRLRELVKHDDFGTRQAALHALAKFDEVDGMPFRLRPETRAILIKALGDEHEDVRFEAARQLAREGNRAALPVLRTMLDRRYLEQFEFDKRGDGLSRYKIHSNLISMAIAAVVRIKASDDPKVLELLERLTDDQHEGDPEVRELARQALKKLAGKEN